MRELFFPCFYDSWTSGRQRLFSSEKRVGVERGVVVRDISVTHDL